MVQVQAKTVVKQLQRIVIVPRSAGPLCQPVYVVVPSSELVVFFEPSTRLSRKQSAQMTRKAEESAVFISKL